MKAPHHLPLLDAVRFACALAVLAYHLLAVFPLAASSVTHDFDPALPLPAGLARYSWWGWVGVDLFFVVSGYVIAISAADGGPGRFVRRRTLRLLPAAWICATLTALVLLLGSSVPATAIAARWATSMALFPLGQPIDEIYWTLGIEVAFYALVACVLRRGDNRARLETIGAGLAFASLAFWVGHGIGVLAMDPQGTSARLLLLPHGGFFAVGIALHALAERRGTALAWATLAGGLVAGTCEIVALAATMSGVPRFTADPRVPLVIFAVGVAVIALARRVRMEGVGAACATLGAVTYPLYLLNQRFAAGMLTWFVHAGLPAGVAVALTAALVTLLAWGIATWAEPRVRRWLASRLSPAAPSDTAKPRPLARSAVPAGLVE